MSVPTNLIPTKITGLPEYTGNSTLGYFPYVLEGRTYQVQFANLAAVGAVPSTRVVAAGTGLTGGGDLSQDRVIAIANGGVGFSQLANSGVTAGSYGSGAQIPVLTIDEKGRVTSATTAALTISGYVPDTRRVDTDASLTGGGPLSSNLTLGVNYYASLPQALGSASAGVSTAAARGDHVHPAVDLSDATQTQGALPLGRGGTGDALSPVAGAVVYSTGTKFALADPGLPGQVLTSAGTGEPYWTTVTGTGTVTSVDLTAGTGISVSGGPITASGSITVTNTAPDQVVTLTGAGTTVVTGTYPNFTITSNDAYTGTVTSVAASGGTTGLTFSGSPITTSGTLTLGGTLNVANGGTGATTATGARTNLGAAASGANSDITSLSGITGAIGTPTYIQFDSGAGTAIAAGRMWYDQLTGAFNLGMGNGNITQQVGEELFVYGKASAAINDSPLKIVYQTGTVGGSGTITFGPTVAGITNGDLIIGVATESLALNQFGRVTSYGIVRGITTDGSAYGETWADGDTIWYNPVTGNPTNIKPSAPNIKVSVGVLIKAGNGGSGSIQVEINHGSVLGGTDSNVQITSVANNDLLQYSSSLGYWRNIAASSVSVGSATTATTATNLAGGAANQIAYQTGAGATGFITAPTVANTFLEWSGSAFQWSSNPLGTVTSVAMTVPTGLTVSGSPITTSGTLAVSLQSGYSIPTTASQANWDTAYTDRLKWDGGSSGLVAATGRTSLGATTVGSNFFTLTNPAAITFPQINADNTVSALSASAFRAAIGAGTGSGSVTSVDVSGGTTGLTFSGGPVTTSGTITMAGTLAVGNGGTGATTLTGYVKGNGTSAFTASSTIPTSDLSGTISLTTQVSGILPVANGGTGTSTAFTAGSIVFAGASGVYSQKNANLFWDNTNNRLGIGTTSPGYALDVASNDTSFGYAARLRSNATAAGAILQFTNSAVSQQNGVFGVTDAGFMTIQADGAASIIAFRTNGAERARIDSSGNFGIGQTNPTTKLWVGSSGSGGSGTATPDAISLGNTFANSAGDAAKTKLRLYQDSSPAYYGFGVSANLMETHVPSAGSMAWYTGNTERMRLGSNGALALGGTGTDATLHIQQAYGGYDRLTQISPNAASKNAFNLMAAKNASSVDLWWSWGVRNDNVWAIQQGVNYSLNSSTGFYFDSGGQAYKSGGGSWAAISDARVKTNIAPISDAASRIMALKPSSFDYRVPEAHQGRVSDRGFIAQEFEQVYPHGVSESLNICDEEKPFFGEGEKLKSVGLNNDFFADLVALVQEQQAIITDLRARVAELERK